MSRRDGRRVAMDWITAERRLATVARTLEGAGGDPEAAAAVLAARARALARVPQPQASAKGQNLVTFSVGAETYGVESAHVRSVFRLVDLSRLPGTGALIAGATLWRGEVLLVLDLQEALHVARGDLDDRAWVVAIGDGSRTLGLLVGAPGEIEACSASELARAEDPASGVRPHLVRGATRAATQVLDVAALLALELQ